MTARVPVLPRIFALALALALGLSGRAPAQEPKSEPAPAPAPADAARAKGDPKAPRPGETTEKATFGGGCFWCTEAVFERIPGVKSAVSGYSGGQVPNPTYEQVCSGLTGHAEVIQVEFDPAVVSFEKILLVFFKSHDPTTLNSQGPDAGTQYRSIILYHSEDQKTTAQKVYRELTARKAFRGRIVTELVPFQAFFPAEAYHQDYYNNHRDADYSQMYIAPKLRKLKLR